MKFQELEKMTKKWRIQFLPVQLRYSLFFLINSAIIEMFVINRGENQ